MPGPSTAPPSCACASQRTEGNRQAWRSQPTLISCEYLGFVVVSKRGTFKTAQTDPILPNRLQADLEASWIATTTQSRRVTCSHRSGSGTKAGRCAMQGVIPAPRLRVHQQTSDERRTSSAHLKWNERRSPRLGAGDLRGQLLSDQVRCLKRNRRAIENTTTPIWEAT